MLPGPGGGAAEHSREGDRERENEDEYARDNWTSLKYSLPPFLHLLVWCSRMYKGEAPSPFPTREEGSLSFNGEQTHPEHFNYTSAWGKIYLILGGNRGRAQDHPGGSDGST